MRTKEEITINGKTMTEIMSSHCEWVNDNETGTRADLRNADLSNADLYGANLYGADLSNAHLRNADLRNADLRNADLRNADLSNADLYGANLYGADLSNAHLYGADLSNADGIYAFGPIGNNKRMGYAVMHDDGVMFKLGCHWGNLDATLTAVNKKYGTGSLYGEQVLLAGKILESKNE